jgi:hypothetical protein
MPPFNDRRVARTKQVTPNSLRSGDYMKTSRGFEQVKELEFEPDPTPDWGSEKGAPAGHGELAGLSDRQSGTYHVWTHQGYETLRHDDTVERTSRGRNKQPMKPGRI